MGEEPLIIRDCTTQLRVSGMARSEYVPNLQAIGTNIAVNYELARWLYLFILSHVPPQRSRVRLNPRPILTSLISPTVISCTVFVCPICVTSTTRTAVASYRSAHLTPQTPTFSPPLSPTSIAGQSSNTPLAHPYPMTNTTPRKMHWAHPISAPRPVSDTTRPSWATGPAH